MLHNGTPGITLSKNILTTEVWEIALKSAIAVPGGVIDPVVDDAAVISAEKAES